jgi:hypothetical protein
MSAAEARAMLSALAEFGEEPVKSMAIRVLDTWAADGEPDWAAAPSPAAPLSPAERSRRYRNRHGRHEDRHGGRDDRHESRDGPRDDPSRNVTAAVTEKVTIVTENVTERDGFRDGRDALARRSDPDLSLISPDSQDFSLSLSLGGSGGAVTETVTAAVTPAVTLAVTESVTPTVTSVVTGKRVRETKRSKTYPPDVEASESQLDTWCMSKGLPPASKVPEVLAMINWHRKEGKGSASWPASWSHWQTSPYARPATIVQPVAPVRDRRTIEREIEERARAAREDGAQETRADRAARRPTSTPRGLAPAAPAAIPRAKTTAEIEEERARQLREAEDFMRGEQPKGATK